MTRRKVDCGCIDKINAVLDKTYGVAVDYTVPMGTGPKRKSRRMLLSLTRTGSRRRAASVTFSANFCPLCGVEYVTT